MNRLPPQTGGYGIVATELASFYHYGHQNRIELTSILTSESEISCGWNFLGFNTKATLVKPYPVLIGMEFFFTYHCMAHVQSDGT